jgi:hypothetical protein
MATIKLNIETGTGTFHLIIENVVLDEEKTVKLNIVLPTEAELKQEQRPSPQELIAATIANPGRFLNEPVRGHEIHAPAELPVAEPSVDVNGGPNHNVGIHSAEDDLPPLENVLVAGGSQGAAQAPGPGLLPPGNIYDFIRMIQSIDGAAPPADVVDETKRIFVAHAGNPDRPKVPIDAILAGLPTQPLNNTERENRAMYRETFSALDDWLRIMMKSPNNDTVVFSQMLDKEFSRYTLKMAKKLDDSVFARMISLMGIPIHPQGVTENNTRLRAIMVGFREGHLDDVLNSLNTPGCACEFCNIR